MASRSRIEFEECLKKGLIRKIVPSRDKARKGINKAKMFLDQARRAFNIKAFDSCLLTC